MNRDDQMTVDMAVMDFMRDHPDAPMAQIIRASVDAAEPLIRADERERIVHNVTAEWAATVHDYRADLRAKVKALAGPMGFLIVEDVLALFDGSSDE